MTRDRSWDLPESKATDPGVAKSRRRWLRAAGLGGVAAALGLGWRWYRGSDDAVLEAGRAGVEPPASALESGPNAATKALDYSLGRKVTRQADVARYVNYYEFSPRKVGTWRIAAALPVRPWTLTVDGLVEHPKTFDIDELGRRFGSEQRVYRHRCVEAWAMVVPWDGFPLRQLVEAVRPLDKANFVRFVTADIESLTGIAPPGGFPWPYQEGLTVQEAVHELAFLATGFYGEPLFKQNGAPIRLVVPWKYGFKSAKSLVRIEFVERRPATFWNTAAPDEYGFYANVDPAVDHPRWSQKMETMIDTGERHPTVVYNGYGKWVADLYRGDEV